MRLAARSLGIVFLALVGVMALGWSGTTAALVQLLATTAFIMGGTQHPLVSPTGGMPYPGPGGTLTSYPLSEPAFADQYVALADNGYIAPTGTVRGDSTDPSGYNLVATYTPEEFWPAYGSRTFDQSVAVGAANLDNCVEGSSCTAHIYDGGPGPATKYVVFGYSQSARVATVEKRTLIARYGPGGTEDPATAPDVSFVLMANPNRPNGGVLERFNGLYIPILGVTFDGATPTDSCDAEGNNCQFPTADITQQYDGWADFPAYPLNLVADINAVAGIAYLHGHYDAVQVSNDTIDQGTYGDTQYYMIATKRLPILMPLAQIGVPDPILAVLDAPLRVIVEMGYDRTTSPGAATPAQLVRLKNPITDVVNLVVAIPTGWDDGIQEAVPALGRPFGTKPAGPYGVGGPQLPTVGQAASATPNNTTFAVTSAQAPTQTNGTGVDGGTAQAKLAQTLDPSLSKTTDSAVHNDTSINAVAQPPAKPKAEAPTGPTKPDVTRPKAFRPLADRPVKKVLDAVTGQHPKATDTVKSDDAPKADSNAA